MRSFVKVQWEVHVSKRIRARCLLWISRMGKRCSDVTWYGTKCYKTWTAWDPIYRDLYTPCLLSILRELSNSDLYGSKETCPDSCPCLCSPVYLSLLWWAQRMSEWHQRHNLAFYQCNSNIRLFVRQQGQTLAQRVHLVLSCYAWLGETRVHDGCLCILFKMLFSPFCAKYAKQVAIWSQISIEITPMLNALGPLRSRKWMKQDPQRERPTFYLLNKP